MDTVATSEQDGYDCNHSHHAAAHDQYDHVGHAHHHDAQSHRYLAGGGAEAEIDYTVVSVGVMTLGLLLVVEFVRHALDHAAIGRPFFKAVLEGVYSELATLGIVELFIFLLHRYYEDLNVARELVFADVHFALFYTAIFNAFQSVIMAILSSRVSTKAWVFCEALDIEHYVELREEFDRLTIELLNTQGSIGDDDIYGVFELSRWKAMCRNVISSFRYPRLRARYVELLVQVRFHQFRVQFLESNDLPITLKVSSYLKKAENTVFIKLIHVSTFAWLLLTGGLNLVYYLMGMVAYITEDKRTVGKSLTWIFFSMLVLFILISLVVYNKMKAIFREIIHMRRLGYIEDHEKGKRRQLELFWGGDPKIVIAMIQFMQFGYALGLAIIMIFWDDIGDGQVEPWWYLVAVLVCYCLFLLVMAQVIPQYTLCTSLGHLVDQKHLQETVALYRLEEAERRQKRKLAERATSLYMDDSSVVLVGADRVESKEPVIKPPAEKVQNKNSLEEEDDDDEVVAPIKTIRVEPPKSPKQGRADVRKKNLADFNDEKTRLLSELVKMDTQKIRTIVPKPAPKPTRQGGIRDRRSRRKSVSDGVQAMRLMGIGTSSAAAHLLLENDNGLDSKPSDVVQPTKALEGPAKTLDDTALAKRDVAAKRRARRARHKAVSASAVIKSWQDMPVTDADTPDSAAGRQANPFFSSGFQAEGRRGRPAPGGLDPLAESTPRDEESSVKPQQPRIDEETSEHPKETIVSSQKPEEEIVFFSEEPKVDEIPAASGDVDVTKSVSPAEGAPLESNKDADGSPETDEPGDDDTVDTAKSVGALSDVSVDIPPSSIGGALANVSQSPPKWFDSLKCLSPTEIKGRLRRFYISNRYLSISHVFGTITCFFFVGNRVEILLHEDGVIVYGDQTIVLRSHVSFWLEVVWLASFLLNSILIIFLFPRSERSGSESVRSLVFSSAFDILISGACLALLFYAESQRCCDKENEDYQYSVNKFTNSTADAHDDDHRILAAASDSDYGDGYGNDEYGYGDNYGRNRDDCCPFWGYRWYGGLGVIEPLTSLIGLRVVRFMIARIVVRYIDGLKKSYSSSTEDDDEDNDEVKVDKSNPFRTVLFGPSDRTPAHDGHPGVKSSMRDEVGTPLHLWEKAIARYPDIVEKYGEFSGQLFQAMLGLEVFDDDEAHVPNKNSDGTSIEDTTAEDKESNEHTVEPDKSEKPQKQKLPSSGQCFVLAGKQYESLPLEAKEIIMAGKLGKPVHCKSSANLLRLQVGGNAEVDNPTSPLSSSPKPTTEQRPDEFEIDDEKLALESKADSHGFIAPNARLVRSMRRCDRRLIPLLTKWGPVDVAVTRFEIVYFEAVDDADITCERTSARLALVATKGGKGLRLCDVALGRKVIGHLDLSDISDVHVERDMPIVDAALLDDLEKSSGDDVSSQLPPEYWYAGESREKSNKDSPQKQLRNIRWAKVTEDRLRLTTIHGILYLRFYSDLEDTEAHLEQTLKESDGEGPIRKNISFQWAQTLGRFCGRDQLKQVLPHLGDNTSGELRDYLEVVHYHEKEVPKKGHHRKKSSGDFLFADQPDKAAHAKRRRFRNSISFGPSETSESRKPKTNPKALQHAHSFDAKEPASGNGTNVSKPKRMYRRSASAGESASSSGPTNYARSNSNIDAVHESEEESVDFDVGFGGIL